MRTQQGLVEDADLGGEPGLHALVIGISRYPYLPSPGEPPRGEQFGLCSVDGPALSAWRLAETLRNPPANATWARPLRTLRLLLLPSEADGRAENALVNWAGPIPDLATVRQVITAWQADCEASDREVALFYFAGHGLRLDEDCLVLAGFGKDATDANPSLSGCCPVGPLMEAMRARQGWSMAREQFWFVDACRTQLDPALVGQVVPPEKLLARRLGDGQDMRQFGLQATGEGVAALTLPGHAGTAFGSALLNGLTGAVSRPLNWPAGVQDARQAWPVNVLSLLDAIQIELTANPTTAGQRPGLLGAGGNGPLILHFAPPEIPVRFSVNPPQKPTAVTGLALQRLGGPPPRQLSVAALAPHPYCEILPAGHYEVQWVSAGQPRTDVWFASLASADLLL